MSSQDSATITKNYTQEEASQEIELALLSILGHAMKTLDDDDDGYLRKQTQNTIAETFDNLRRMRRWDTIVAREDAHELMRLEFEKVDQIRVLTLKAHAEVNLKNIEVCLKTSQVELETAKMKNEREALELAITRKRAEEAGVL